MNVLEMKHFDLLGTIIVKIGGYAYNAKVESVIHKFFGITSVGYAQVGVHTKRVALVAEAVAKKIGADTKFVFAVGLLHDIGKLTCQSDFFDGRDIDAIDYARVKRHAVAGYIFLQEIDLEIALAVGLHHSLGKGGYGLSEKDIPKHLPKDVIVRILEAAIIISVCDYADSFLTRKTNIHGEVSAGLNLRQKLSDKYPNHESLVGASLEIVGEFYGINLVVK